jgi:hypothetical protein
MEDKPVLDSAATGQVCRKGLAFVSHRIVDQDRIAITLMADLASSIDCMLHVDKACRWLAEVEYAKGVP